MTTTNLITATPAAHQRDRARLRGNRVRQQRKEIRRALIRHELTLAQAVDGSHPAGEGMLIWELLLMVPGVGEARLTAINRAAIRERVNLAQRVETASSRTRAWIVQAVERDAKPCAVRALPAPPTPLNPAAATITAALLSAVAEHRHDVRSPNAPAEAFGQADEKLYARCQQLAASVHKLACEITHRPPHQAIAC